MSAAVSPETDLTDDELTRCLARFRDLAALPPTTPEGRAGRAGVRLVAEVVRLRGIIHTSAEVAEEIAVTTGDFRDRLVLAGKPFAPRTNGAGEGGR